MQEEKEECKNCKEEDRIGKKCPTFVNYICDEEYEVK